MRAAVQRGDAAECDAWARGLPCAGACGALHSGRLECRYFAGGHCARGDACPYSHGTGGGRGRKRSAGSLSGDVGLSSSAKKLKEALLAKARAVSGGATPPTELTSTAVGAAGGGARPTGSSSPERPLPEARRVPVQSQTPTPTQTQAPPRATAPVSTAADEVAAQAKVAVKGKRVERATSAKRKVGAKSAPRMPGVKEAVAPPAGPGAAVVSGDVPRRRLSSADELPEYDEDDDGGAGLMHGGGRGTHDFDDDNDSVDADFALLQRARLNRQS